MPKCKDCDQIKLVDLNWPYCTILDDYVTLDRDDRCEYCPLSNANSV